LESEKEKTDMTRADIYRKLDEVFQDVFDDESIHVSDETTANDIEDWDSLEHINLMVAGENAFGIKFNMGQIGSLKNVGEMVDLIEKKVG
jgi:acyl carrier protein